MKASDKSKTNNGEFAKQSFVAVKIEEHDSSLIVRKLVLSDDFELYNDFKLLKKYKNKGLFEQRFGIKLSTLSTVILALTGEELKQQ